MLKLKMDQMRGDNKQLTRRETKRFLRQILGLLGDTLVALVIGMLGLFVLGGIIGAIWNLIA